MVAIGVKEINMRMPGGGTLKTFLKPHSAASNNAATCYPSDKAALLKLFQSLGLIVTTKRSNTTRNTKNNSSSQTSEKTNKTNSKNKYHTSGVAFSQTDEDSPGTTQSTAQLLMTGYSAHDNGNLYGSSHFLQTSVYYADSDADSDDEESVNSDLDEPYQLQLPDVNMDGIDNMIDSNIDGVNYVHLTWEIEQLPNNTDHNIGNQSKSTASSFHNIGIDDTSTDSEAMPLLVPQTGPGDSDLKHEPGMFQNDNL